MLTYTDALKKAIELFDDVGAQHDDAANNPKTPASVRRDHKVDGELLYRASLTLKSMLNREE